MAFIPENTIQMFLLSVSDILRDNNVYTTPQNIVKINPKKSGKQAYSTEEMFKVLKSEHELFSSNPVPNAEISKELFKSFQEKNVTRQNDYIVSHNISWVKNLNSNISKFYTFNIDTFNKTNEKIFIKKLNITNKSKDIYTAKSNYSVTLEIYFTTYSDLLEPNIQASYSSTDNRIGIEDISILNLIFPNYDKNNTIPTAEQEVRDQNGIFLHQVLSIVDTTKFSNLINFLGKSSVEKNYHLIIKKHSFEIAREDDPISKRFENLLKIEYVAYDVDNSEKTFKSNIIPSINENLYSLLSNLQGSEVGGGGDILGTTLTQIQRLTEEINKSQQKLNCFQLSQRLQSLINSKEGEVSKAETSFNSLAAEFKTNQEENIKALLSSIQTSREQIDFLKFELKKFLFLRILELIEIYKINVPLSLLSIYERNFEWNDFFNSISVGGALSAAGTGASFGSIAGAKGAAIGAVGGVALYAGSNLASSILAEPLVTDSLNISDIRDKLDSVQVTKIDSKLSSKKQALFNLTSDSAAQSFQKIIATQSGASTAPANAQSTAEQQKNLSAVVDAAAAVDAPEQDQFNTGYADIFFTTLGDIFNILTKLDSQNKTKIITGGKNFVINNQPNISHKFVNFADTPINIRLLFKFLDANILKVERGAKYSTDAFIKDIFQTLLKDALLNDGPNSKSYITALAPTSLKMNSSIHFIPDGNASLLMKEINPLEDVDYILYKQVFNQTKFFDILRTDLQSIYKFYTIIEDQDIKYYNFYESYTAWALSKNLSIKESSDVSGYNFQRYINEQHLMPCILTQYTAMYESILKKKNVSFTRQDNSNLIVGQILQDSPFLRLPYNISADIWIYNSFFVDVGTLLFVSPPASGTGSTSSANKIFGFGGLYVINESSIEYMFQRMESGQPTFPNSESSYKISGLLLSHGDGIAIKSNIPNSTNVCNDPKPANASPAAAPSP